MSAQADGLGWHRDATLWRRTLPARPIEAARRGATFDGSRGFQPTDGDDTRKVRRGATIGCEKTATHIRLAANGVAMIQASLRDEIDWRDCRPWVETHGYLRRSLRDQGQERKSFRPERGGASGGTTSKKLSAEGTNNSELTFKRERRHSLIRCMHSHFLCCTPNLKQAGPPRARRGATSDGSRGFQTTDTDDARKIRRGATIGREETAT